jgi:carboxypeptidase family protein/TonB-dependent receptor-like protein
MKTNATKILVLICALGLLFSATPLRAQVSGATLSGTITDAQGGAVVGAKISARNGATGVTTESSANSSGAYSIVNLIPADYDVSVSAAGFRTAVSKVTLTVGGQQALNVALIVGDVSQTVEVTGAAPVVETTNATLSGEVVGSQIATLPLNGRDWVSLAALTPGVVSVRPHEDINAPGGSTRGLGIQMTINGARPQQNVYRLNGVIVNDYSNAGPGNVLGNNAGVDAIQEFSVLTGNYSAEYGDTSAGVINAITKSGTNTFHGSAYEFLRNSSLDAANRFEDPNPQLPAGVKKGNFVRNQFGASAGWKVLRDRAFLFGNYEGFRQAKAIPQQPAVLTTNARLGIINDKNGNPLPALPDANCPYAKFDPNGMTNEAPPGSAAAIAAGHAAAVCVDNFIFAELNPCTGVTPCPSGVPPGVLAPLPNGALITNPNNQNDNAYYVSDLAQYASDNYGTVRGDLRITEKDSLVGSWYRDTSTWRRPGNYGPPNLSYSGNQVPHSAYTVEETHVFNPSLVNSLRVGLARSDLFSPQFFNNNPVTHVTTLQVVQPNGTTATEQIGILPGWVAGGGSVGGNGNSTNSINVTGAMGGYTGAPGFSSRTNKIELFDDVSKTIGKHTLKIGFETVDDHENWLNGPARQGGGGPSFASLKGSLYGSCPASPVNTAASPLPLSCGGGVAAYLMDAPKSVRLPIEPPFASNLGVVHHWRSNIYGVYFQDDWKMFSNLTVNLGLRYEMSTIPWVTDNNINNVETLDQGLLFRNLPGACVADVNGSASCPGFYHATFQSNPTTKNFEPRVGFAWDPFKDGKTAVRGGVGIFDVLPLSFMFALNSLQTAPSSAETDLSYAPQIPNGTGGTCTGATNCLPNGKPAPSGWGHFPLTEAGDATNTSIAGLSNPERWQYVQPNPKRNYVMQYNLNIQRQLTQNLSIMIAYAGSRSWHDPLQSDDLNTVFPYNVGGRWLFPNPVGSGCLPTPPNCSNTDVALGIPVGYVNADATTCVNGTANGSSSCISTNHGITPGLLINSNTAQFQSTIFPVQSWYNSLQVKVDKRVSHGLMIGGSFTWGKSFDTSSSSFASDNYSNNPSAIVPWWDLSVDKGLSDFNVTKRVSFNFLYSIPTPASFHGPLAAVAGGWAVAGNFEASDGIPLWPLITNETVGMLNGGAYDIPDLVPGCQQILPDWRKTLNYLNPACYILPQAPSNAFYNTAAPKGCDPSFAAPTCVNLLGNDPRNAVIGPGLINMDFAVTKDTHIRKISEATNLQFRAEIFNIANHPNYAFPIANNLSPIDNTGAAVPAFGTLTQTQGSEREIQFALKLIW